MSMLNHFFNYKPEVLALDEKAMELCQPYFRHMEEIRDFNQLKMLKAFADTQMSSTDMLGTTGYGLWDTGRAKLEQIFAEVMGAEDALVRSQFQSGTHTLAVALFGLLRAGDTLLAATGRPYDTLEGVIGLDGKGKGTGTLMDYGIRYDEAPLKADFTPDYDLIAQKAPGAKVCHIQRSRGYLQRNAFDLETIRKIADTARAANPDIIIFVDNCYGEFTQTQEPCQMGADLVVGSLIKNPGGGIASLVALAGLSSYTNVAGFVILTILVVAVLLAFFTAYYGGLRKTALSARGIIRTGSGTIETSMFVIVLMCIATVMSLLGLFAAAGLSSALSQYSYLLGSKADMLDSLLGGNAFVIVVNVAAQVMAVIILIQLRGAGQNTMPPAAAQQETRYSQYR